MAWGRLGNTGAKHWENWIQWRRLDTNHDNADNKVTKTKTNQKHHRQNTKLNYKQTRVAQRIQEGANARARDGRRRSEWGENTWFVQKRILTLPLPRNDFQQYFKTNKKLTKLFCHSLLSVISPDTMQVGLVSMSSKLELHAQKLLQMYLVNIWAFLAYTKFTYYGAEMHFILNLTSYWVWIVRMYAVTNTLTNALAREGLSGQVVLVINKKNWKSR